MKFLQKESECAGRSRNTEADMEKTYHLRLRAQQFAIHPMLENASFTQEADAGKSMIRLDRLLADGVGGTLQAKTVAPSSSSLGSDLRRAAANDNVAFAASRDETNFLADLASNIPRRRR